VTTVCCVGVATLDRIAIVDRVPGSDERTVAEPFVVSGGGPAATAAVTLARLGIDVAFCGVVGDDEAGASVRDGLAVEGVDVTALQMRPGARTPESMILVERGTGARTIITTPSIAPDAESVPLDVAWLHADQTGYAAVRDARGPRISIDGGNDIADLRLAGVALYAPTLPALRARFGDEDEEALLTAAAAGAETVVATDGGDGAIVLASGAITRVPAVEVDVVSTMGAGDVFHGALLAGIVSGLDPVESARRAAFVAARSCTALDGRSGIPTLAEVDDAMNASAVPREKNA